METKQNTFDFPSPELQEAVGKLWDTVHQVRGTITFLLESNKELKQKLDSKSASTPDADNRIAELEELTAKLEQENDDYKYLAEESSRAIEDIKIELSGLQDIKANYFILQDAYRKLKDRLNAREEHSFKSELNNHSIDIQKDLEFLKEEVANKNKEIAELTTKVIKFNNTITESKQQIAELSKLKSENEKLKDQLETLSSSREVLREEADNLSIEFEKERARLNAIIKKQQMSIEAADGDRVAWENDLKELSDRLEDSEFMVHELRSSKTELENELADLKIQLSELKQKEDTQCSDSSEIIELRTAISQKDIAISELNKELQSITAGKSSLEVNMGKLNEEIQDLRKALFERENEIGLLNSKLIEQKSKASDNSANELEVKDKMIKEFVAAEKRNYEKMIELEQAIAEKDKLINIKKQNESEFNAKINSISMHLSEKDNRIEELMNKNKKLNKEISTMNELAQTGADASLRIAEIRQYCDIEINKTKEECKIHLIELKARTDSLKSLEAENNKLREKLKSIELKNMKSDEAITIDEILRENLIFRIEKSLLNLEKIIDK